MAIASPGNVRSLGEDNDSAVDLARRPCERTTWKTAKYLRTQIKATFVHKESPTRTTLKRNIAIEWCAKTHLHKCSGRDAAFILQRGVHRRANTLSRHKYLVGEQGRSLNPGGERRSAGRRLRVHTSWRSMVFDDPISWLSRGGRWTDGRGVGVSLSHFQITHSRYSHLHGRRLANLPYASPRVWCSARFVTSTSMPITPSESYRSPRYANVNETFTPRGLESDKLITVREIRE